jgi:hypothetical protein
MGLVGLLLAWLGYREQRKSMSREIELKLWEEGDRSVQGQIILRNGSREGAVVDLIKVVTPERSKIAWLAKKQDSPLASIKTLEDDGVTDEHRIRLEVSPGATGTVSFFLGFPYLVETLDKIAVECRIHPKDRVFGVLPKEWRRVSLPARLIQKSYSKWKAGQAGT